MRLRRCTPGMLELDERPIIQATPNPRTMIVIVHHSGDLVVVILIRSALRTAITVHLP